MAEASLLAMRNLLKNLANEVAALKKFTKGTRSSNSGSDSETSSPMILESFSPNAESSRAKRKTAQDESKKITRGLGWLKSKYEDARLRNYLTSEGSINYEKLLFSVILSEDKNIRKVTRAHDDWSGTTALVAVIEGSQLIVANVGDSRGVMCDSKGDAVPLSFDHKPDRKEEKMRITRMFGRVEKDEYGTYRVDGSLAVSRTLGDRWAKGFYRVIATPEIFTFDLSDYKPQFLVLATDGLYDELSSAEVVAFVKEKLTEPYFGARDLVRLAYQLGSEDNITVLVINFNGGRFGPRNYKPAADQQTIGTRAAVKTRWVDRVPFLKNVFRGRKGFRKTPSSKKRSNSSLSVEYI
nr:PREDICTED: protein phosphatase 1L-like [Bemisia tabaci]